MCNGAVGVQGFAFRLAALGVAAAAAAAFPGETPHAAGGAASSWCFGGSTSSADRTDTVTGAQFHLIYAHPPDWASRFSTYAQWMVEDISAIDSWWRTQDSSRAPRFDVAAPPAGCTGLGALDISYVQLPHPWEHYAADSGRFEQVRTDLVAAGFSHPWKKYVVYFDGPVAAPNSLTYCGQGNISAERGGEYGYSMLYSICRERYGESGSLIVAHEMLHALGSRTRCSDSAHTCDTQSDVLHPFFTAGDRLAAKVLDSGRNEYYGSAAGGFDVRGSRWLRRLDAAPHQLTVRVEGRGGTLASNLPGLAGCADTCTTTWDDGTSLSLFFDSTKAGAVWRGWSGACSGTGPCTITMDGPKTVVARLALPVRLTVEVTGDGQGAVTSDPAGISCGTTCATSFDIDSRVTLRADAEPGSRFAGWSGACSGSAPACVVDLSEAKAAGARFDQVQETVTVRVRGRGRVASAPGGLACRAVCSAQFPSGTHLEFSAKAAAGWRFAGWSGACRGTRTCTVTADGPREVVATFKKKPPPKRRR